MSEFSGRSRMSHIKINPIPIIIIAGPTASGKSGLGIELAKRLNGVIINADSMQVYKEIPILSAAPNSEEQAQVPHKLYGIYEATNRGNIMDWLTLCRQEIDTARSQNQTPIIIGGTGMYLDGLLNGLSPIPETPQAIRDKVENMLQEKGLSHLYKILQDTDAKTAQKLSPNDNSRIRRAVEIWLDTNKPLSYWHNIPPQPFYPAQEFFKIYIKPPRSELDKRLRIRFDKMMEKGALDEVKKLLPLQLSDSLPAMRALGVQELKGYLENTYTLEEAIELGKLHTRQYAKRQSTWFNNRFNADSIYEESFGSNTEKDNFFVNELVDKLQKRYKILAK